MVHDTIAFSASAARNGLTSVVVAVNEDNFATTGSGAQLLMPYKGKVIGFTVVSEAIANFVKSRFHKMTDDKWNYIGAAFARDQTGAYVKSFMARLGYEFDKDDKLVLESDNGNNAQLETHILHITDGNDRISLEPSEVPPNTRIVYATGAATATADVWTKVPTLTFLNYEFAQKKMYRIHGLAAWGATMHTARLQHKAGSPHKTKRPGIGGGDTATPAVYAMHYAHFGDFEGANPPGAEIICSAGDTSQLFQLLIEEL